MKTMKCVMMKAMIAVLMLAIAAAVGALSTACRSVAADGGCSTPAMEQPRTSGHSFALDTQPLPDGRTLTYICVRGSVCDMLIPEEPDRDYSQRGTAIEGALVWLKRNPRCQAVTDASGLFEIIVENGVLSRTDNPKDDVVCVWQPGYEVAEVGILKWGIDPKALPGERDSFIRISDYDTTRYIKMKRTADWDKLCELAWPAIRLKKDVKVDKKVMPEEMAPLQKPLLTPWTLPDGREVVDLDLTGTITDSGSGRPIQYAGVWLKRNPTILAMTDENGSFRMRMESVGLRPRTEELSDSICASAGAYASREIPLKNFYKGDVAMTLEKFPAFRISGDFIQMIDIPANFFRMGLGLTQGGGQGRDQVGDTSMWADLPVRTVTLPAYSIGKYPITRAQYYKVLDWAQKHGYDLEDPMGVYVTASNHSPAYHPQEPMNGINWFDAAKWCNAASEMEGRTPCYYDADGQVCRRSICEEPRIKWRVNGYRLPTRAEWDHAAAGGTHFDFWWPEGFRNIREYAYFFADSLAQGISTFATHPIGQKKPNPFGLYDITQVGERCWDWNGPFSGDETYHPKGCSRTDAINYLKSFLLGFHQPERETPESEGGWGVGTCQGDSDWSVIRRRYGNPTDWGHAHGVRVVISGQRGDEDARFPVVFDRLRGLPRPVALDKITDKLELAQIPAGSVDIGSGVPGIRSSMQQDKLPCFDERPEHKVCLSAFRIAKYETTVAQWNRVYDWAAQHGYQFDTKGGLGHSSSDDPRHPAVGMSWFDVVKWCNAASEMEQIRPVYYSDSTFKTVYRTGQLKDPAADWTAAGYRLPTEAEWEYAAFGGVDDCAYYWGNFISRIRDYAWVGGWFGDSGRDDPDALRKFLKTVGPNWVQRMFKQYGWKMWEKQHIPYPDHASHPVGQKIGNRYGLYDVFGNAAEMCWDRMAPFALTIDDRGDPKGPKSEAQVADFLARPYALPGHDRDRALKISARPTEADLRTVKGCNYLSGHGVEISGRHGPFLSARSGMKPQNTEESVGFRVAAGK